MNCGPLERLIQDEVFCRRCERFVPRVVAVFYEPLAPDGSAYEPSYYCQCCYKLLSGSTTRSGLDGPLYDRGKGV